MKSLYSLNIALLVLSTGCGQRPNKDAPEARALEDQTSPEVAPAETKSDEKQDDQAQPVGVSSALTANSLESNEAESAKSKFEDMTCAEKWSVFREKNPVGLKLTYKQSISEVRDGKPVSFESFDTKEVIASTEEKVTFRPFTESEESVTKAGFIAECDVYDTKEVKVVREPTTSENFFETTIVPGVSTTVIAGTYPSQLRFSPYKDGKSSSNVLIWIATDGSGWVLKTRADSFNLSWQDDGVVTRELMKVEY